MTPEGAAPSIKGVGPGMLWISSQCPGWRPPTEEEPAPMSAELRGRDPVINTEDKDSFQLKKKKIYIYI